MRKLLATTALMALASLAYGYDDATDDLDIEVVSDRGYQYDVHPLRTSNRETFRAYLEAVPQENYSIRVRNRSGDRIGVVIAVDGRNIISGSKSDLKSSERMYILGPYESATYAGWRTSRNRINRFYFTHADDSYSAAFGDYSAMGVIAVAGFREKRQYRAPQRWNKRDDSYENNSRSGKSAPEAAQKNGRALDDAGTGYGDDAYSPSVRVEFEAERNAFAKFFLKYEWRETLCEKGIMNCYSRNRFWDDHGQRERYAPPPPKRRWFSRWHW